MDIEGVFEVTEPVILSGPDDSDQEGPPGLSHTDKFDRSGTIEPQTRLVRRPYLRSQPLPFPVEPNCSSKDAELISITLADFGKGAW